MIKTNKTIMYKILDKSKNAARVFVYIEEHLKLDALQIELSPTEIAKQCNIDKGNVATAIKQLVELGVIKKTVDLVPEEIKDKIPNSRINYTVEPKYVFNGNLLKLKKKITEMRKNNQLAIINFSSKDAKVIISSAYENTFNDDDEI